MTVLQSFSSVSIHSIIYSSYTCSANPLRNSFSFPFPIPIFLFNYQYPLNSRKMSFCCNVFHLFDLLVCLLVGDASVFISIKDVSVDVALSSGFFCPCHGKSHLVLDSEFIICTFFNIMCIVES